MKYKVGDKVRVRDDLITYKEYNGYCVVPKMLDTCNKYVTISQVNIAEPYSWYDIAENNFVYTEEMFEKPILAVNYDGSLNLDAKEDLINNPKHYTTGGIETIDFIEAKNLNFRLANAVKYLTRAEHKGSKLSDLKKAIWYIQREIDKSESVE
jgi:hypothetical protein